MLVEFENKHTLSFASVVTETFKLSSFIICLFVFVCLLLFLNASNLSTAESGRSP